MAVDYKKYDFKIFESLVEMRSALSDFEDIPEISGIIAHLDEIKKRVQSKRIRVAVVGEFKRGKSSLINALLGSEILPADIEPATAAVNRVTYGSVPKAQIRFKDGSVKDVKVEELSSYVTKLTSESAETAKKIEEAVVEFPSLLCRDYVDIIDTPGMNDSDDMSLITLDELKNIDLAVAVLSANMPVSDTEGEFITRITESDGIGDIVLVITHIDCIETEDERKRIVSVMASRVKKKVLDNLKRNHPEGDPIFEKYSFIFDNLNIFAVSCADALDALRYNNIELLEQSGITCLNLDLPRIILKNQNNSAIFNSVKEIRAVRKEYAEAIEVIVKNKNFGADTINNAKKEAMNIIGHLENMQWQYSEARINELIGILSGNIALMFDEWVHLQKPKPRLIRRRIRKQKKAVLKFMCQYINFIFCNDIINDAYLYAYNMANKYLSGLEDMCDKYKFPNGLKDIAENSRKKLSIQQSAERMSQRCRWVSNPVPPRRVCLYGDNEKIYSHIKNAVSVSLSAAVKGMQGDFNQSIHSALREVIKVLDMDNLKLSINACFSAAQEELDRTKSEFVTKKFNIEKNINAAVYKAEQTEKELLNDIKTDS